MTLNELKRSTGATVQGAGDIDALKEVLHDRLT